MCDFAILIKKKKEASSNKRRISLGNNGRLGDNFDASMKCLNEIRGALKDDPHLRRVY